jgi:hypothetical protein
MLRGESALVTNRLLSGGTQGKCGEKQTIEGAAMPSSRDAAREADRFQRLQTYPTERTKEIPNGR